jgi:predicted nucleic-acid-binding protein
MISLDTNVLVRLLVDDDGQADQCERARQAISQYDHAFVSQIVQVETAWVLKRAYDFSRFEIIGTLEHLIINRAFKLEYPESFKEALAIYRHSNVDFADALILRTSRQHQLELLTFDTKLARLPGATKPPFLRS